jgi:hypothetical protein
MNSRSQRQRLQHLRPTRPPLQKNWRAPRCRRRIFGTRRGASLHCVHEKKIPDSKSCDLGSAGTPVRLGPSLKLPGNLPATISRKRTRVKKSDLGKLPRCTGWQPVLPDPKMEKRKCRPRKPSGPASSRCVQQILNCALLVVSLSLGFFRFQGLNGMSYG